MRKMNKKPIIYIAGIAALSLCAYQTKTLLDKPNDPIYKNLDPTVSPGADFFMYANGTWLKQNPIPPAYSSWGIGNEVTEEIRDRLKKINEDALTAHAPQGSSTQKIGDFYYTGLDSAGIEKAGITPLQEQLTLIDQAKDTQDILNT
jgi:putative endopeptidase